MWYLQKDTNGARWAYGGEHPLREFNLYIKSWHSKYPCVIVKEPGTLSDEPTGEMSVSMTSLLGTKQTTITKSEINHNFHIDWGSISKLSVGGGSNCAIADFRVYDKLLTDEDVQDILDLKNPDFNSAGPSFP